MELNEWSVVATIGAAIGTTASAVVVAFQAVYTKRSAQSAEAAVAVAQDTLREAQIARLDARAPQLVITTTQFVYEDVTRLDANFSSEKIEDGTIFRLPRDAEVKLRTAVNVEIRNNGQSPVRLSLSTGLKHAEPHRARSVVIEAGQTIKGNYLLTCTVAKWKSAYDYARSGPDAPPEVGSLIMTYRGPNDADIDAVYVVQNHGSILEPLPDQEGAWRTAGLFDRLLYSVVQPAVFTYNRSRSKGDVIN